MEDGRVKSFEDLEVWRVARQVVNAVYALSREAGLARDFGLCGQVQRAAVSIMSNVAEGFERGSSTANRGLRTIVQSGA